MTLLNRLDEAQRVFAKQSTAGVQDGTRLNKFLDVCSENSFGLQHLILALLVLVWPCNAAAQQQTLVSYFGRTGHG